MGKEFIVSKDLAEYLAKEDWVQSLWYETSIKLKSRYGDPQEEPYRTLTISAEDIEDYDNYLTLISKIESSLVDYDYKLNKEFYDNAIYLMMYNTKQKFKIYFSVKGKIEEVFNKVTGCEMRSSEYSHTYKTWSCKA